MAKRSLTEIRDQIYDLIRDHVEVIEAPRGLRVGRGLLSPEETWLFERILEIVGCPYPDQTMD